MTVIANRRSVMTLFSKPTDPWSHRTRLVLAEKSITIDIVDVDDGTLPEDLLDLNPYNSVPTLVDRDLVLYDSRVIMEYLDERFPASAADAGRPRDARAVSAGAVSHRARLVFARRRDRRRSRAQADDASREGARGKHPVERRDLRGEEVLLERRVLARRRHDCADSVATAGVRHQAAAQARPIQRYMDDVFSRPSFQASLTDMERELRQ